MVSKKHFCAKKFFFWLVPLAFGVGAPKIRDPSPNLGVGIPKIGDPSPSAPKIRDPSPNLGVGTPHLKKIGNSRKRLTTSWEISHLWRERGGGYQPLKKNFFSFLDDSDHV